MEDVYPGIQEEEIPADLLLIMEKMTDLNPMARMTPDVALLILDAY